MVRLEDHQGMLWLLAHLSIDLIQGELLFGLVLNGKGELVALVLEDLLDRQAEGVAKFCLVDSRCMSSRSNAGRVALDRQLPMPPLTGASRSKAIVSSVHLSLVGLLMYCSSKFSSGSAHHIGIDRSWHHSRP